MVAKTNKPKESYNSCNLGERHPNHITDFAQYSSLNTSLIRFVFCSEINKAKNIIRNYFTVNFKNLGEGLQCICPVK